MNNCIKASLLTLALGTVFAVTEANAVQTVYGLGANAPGRCQAFTPGITNTIRNRVIGSENVGSSAIAVACDFEVGLSDDSSNALAVEMWFSNNSANPINVDCTLLSGWQGATGAVLINKSASVVTGVQTGIFFDSDDTPDPADTDLGFPIVGVNCTLPTSGVINDTYVYWADENGV